MHSDLISQTHEIITVINRGVADVAALVAAPGAGYRLVVVGYSYHVETAEAGKQVTIEQTGSAVKAGIIPLTTVGATGTVDCNVPLTANTALTLNTDGTTGKWVITVNYYKQRT